jgi:hypothetical protein
MGHYHPYLARFELLLVSIILLLATAPVAIPEVELLELDFKCYHNLGGLDGRQAPINRHQLADPSHSCRR